MCRYSDKDYKTSYACLKHRHAAKFAKGASPRCPTCQQPMMHMGREFKPPKKSDLKGWAKLRDTAYSGKFDSCGC